MQKINLKCNAKLTLIPKAKVWKLLIKAVAIDMPVDLKSLKIH